MSQTFREIQRKAYDARALGTLLGQGRTISSSKGDAVFAHLLVFRGDGSKYPIYKARVSTQLWSANNAQFFKFLYANLEVLSDCVGRCKKQDQIYYINTLSFVC